jgi:hypothetical protein
MRNFSKKDFSAKENPQTVKPAGTFIEIVDGGISKFIVSLS